MDSVRVEELERAGLVRTTWLPYELHPGVPPEGIPRERYFGSSARVEQMRAHMHALAAEAGLQMESRDTLVNSRLALATAEFARERGAYECVHRALFEAHWHLTGRLEEVADLQRIAAACGLDPDELGEALAEGRYDQLLDDRRREAETVGINAIPAHIFGNRYLVVGAHPAELFRQVVEKLTTG